MTTTPPTSPAPQLYELQETIYDGEAEYGSPGFFLARGPKEAENHVRHLLREYHVKRPEHWTYDFQEVCFEIPGDSRLYQFTVTRVEDLYERFGVPRALPPVRISLRGHTVVHVEGVKEYTVLDYDLADWGSISASEIIPAAQLKEVRRNKIPATRLGSGEQWYSRVSDNCGPDRLVVGLESHHRTKAYRGIDLGWELETAFPYE